MKYVIFTYDIRMKGKEDEACMTVLLDDDRAAVVKAAYDNRQGSSEIEDILLRCKVDDLCAACEALRGRKYLRNSIKCVEIEEAGAVNIEIQYQAEDGEIQYYHFESWELAEDDAFREAMQAFRSTRTGKNRMLSIRDASIGAGRNWKE